MIKPLKNRLIVEPVLETKYGAIELPEHFAKTSANIGKVISCGPDCKEIKAGDRVYYGMGMNQEVGELEGKLHIFFREPDILAVLE